MYWSVRSSTSAGSSFSPDLYVRSRTAPVAMFRILRRRERLPLPRFDELEVDHHVGLVVDHHLEALLDVARVHAGRFLVTWERRL